MNPRRNIKATKNRRKKNERWIWNKILSPWCDKAIYDYRVETVYGYGFLNKDATVLIGVCP